MFLRIQFLIIMMSSLLCFIGSRELLSRNSRILEYYVGIKATLFINLVMGAFIYELVYKTKLSTFIDKWTWE